VAAAIAVIVGIASMRSPGSSNSKASSAPLTTGLPNAELGKAADRATPPNAPNPPADLGEVPDANQLRGPARRLLQKSADNPSDSQLPTSAPKPGGTYASTGAADSATNKSFAAAAPACTTARLRDYTAPDRPALIASGTVAGTPVVILIYDGAGAPYANVIRVSDCALIRKLPLG
jgi:hypothetical protein